MNKRNRRAVDSTLIRYGRVKRRKEEGDRREGAVLVISKVLLCL